MKDFASISIATPILQVLQEKNIVTPTEIQASTIPLLLEHEGDFAGRSATGTGKTYAFGIPLLSRIDTSNGKTQGIVLVPTRELCEQVGKELKELGKHMPDLKIESIYGGTSLKAQVNELSHGVQVIVATPGRLMDLLGRKVVDLSTVKFIVFDEADEMLLKGFQTDIDKILNATDRNYASWLFSATMPDDIHILIKKYLNKALKKVSIGDPKKTNTGIDHQVIEVMAEEKLNVLLHFLGRFGDQKIMIFCKTKSGVQKLYKQLSANKFSCGAIHGNVPQGIRNKVMEQYREGHIHILLATDIASRGIDVDDVAYVIQYHLPDAADIYTHRSGRTSRAGKNGTSITFIFPEEKERLLLLEKSLKQTFKHIPLPSSEDQLVNKAILWASKIAKEKPSKIGSDSKQAFKNELEHLSKDELFEKLLANYLREQQG